MSLFYHSKKPWNDMIGTLTSPRVHVIDLYLKKASRLCSMFYLLYRVPHVAQSLHLRATFPQVSPMFSLISISVLSVFLFGVTLSRSPTWSRNASTKALPHVRSCNDSLSLTWSIKFYGAIVLRYPSQHMLFIAPDYLSKEPRFIALGYLSY